MDTSQLLESHTDSDYGIHATTWSNSLPPDNLQQEETHKVFQTPRKPRQAYTMLDSDDFQRTRVPPQQEHGATAHSERRISEQRTTNIGNATNKAPDPLVYSTQFDQDAAMEKPGPVRTRSGKRHRAFWILITSFVAALVIAAGHLVFVLCLNGRRVASAIGQSYVSLVSIAFVQMCSIILSVALTTGMTQLLWWYMRTRP